MYQDISILKEKVHKVPPNKQIDPIYNTIKKKALQLAAKHKLPCTITEWEYQKQYLYNAIIENSHVHFYHDLPFEMKVTGIYTTANYTVQNIYFQTLPNVFATANLYIPNGKGPFPAVINLHGHINDGRLNSSIINRANILASHGFVCLCIDSFGSGERSEIYGQSDYHGSNKGAALFNINETLLGLQVSENIRCVDLLSNLNFVDRNNIGVTGESGGGNQAMWLAAIDQRIKAVIPVVSVGTFESFVMEHNCVCELLLNGLTICEEFQVLGLIAPRALNIFNAFHDTHPTFVTNEMVKSAKKVAKIYNLYTNSDALFRVQIFNTSHNYSEEMLTSMLLWFNKHLKGANDILIQNIPNIHINIHDFMVFSQDDRKNHLITQSEFLASIGQQIENEFLQTNKSANHSRKILRSLLKINTPKLFKPKLYFGTNNTYAKQLKHVILHIRSKTDIISEQIFAQENEGQEFYLEIDLLGLGSLQSHTANFYDAEMVPFHTLSRALFWVGKSVLGEWVHQIDACVNEILSLNDTVDITIKSEKEPAIAVLFYSALYPNKIKNIELKDAFITYLAVPHNKFDYYNMSVHLKGILHWGNIVNATALSNATISFISPRNFHGLLASDAELNQFIQKHSILKQQYHTHSVIKFF